MTIVQLPQAVPAKDKLFDPAQDAYGSRLALVFGNESRTGACPFFGRHCFHCDIGAGEGAFNTPLNRQRLEFFKQHYRAVLEHLNHLVLYNSGSLLNPREMSAETLEMLLAYARSLAHCRVISLDSREMFVTQGVLARLVAGVRSDQQLRITIGLETQDDHARCTVLNKNLTRAGMEQAFAAIAQFGGLVGAELNLVFQSPGISQENAIADACQTFTYGLELGKNFHVSVDFNFHPYYPSAIGQNHFPDHPRSRLRDAVAAITRGRKLIDHFGNRSNIYIGWHDEGHDQEGNQREKETRGYFAGFLEFNRTQDPAKLVAIQN